MLTDHDLESGLAEAFRGAVGPPDNRPDNGTARPATGRAAVDAAGLFQRGVTRRRRQLVMRTAGVAAAFVLVAGVLGGYLVTRPATSGGPVATRTAVFGAPGVLLDAAVARPRPATAASAGMPRYYVVADHTRPAAEVHASGTGRLLSTVALPSGTDPKTAKIAAAPGGLSYVLALSVFPRTKFYQLSLGHDGRSGRLSTLALPALTAGESANGLAVSPGGSRVAVGIQQASGHGSIEVAALHGTAHRQPAVHTWTSWQAGWPGQLSWAHGGRELGFVWQVDGPSRSSAAAGLWVLDTAGGRLTSPRRVLPGWVGGDSVQSALLAPDGGTVTAAVTYNGGQHVESGTVTGGIVQISVQTGRPVSTLLAEHAAYSGDPGRPGWYVTSCLLAAADTSGRHLLVSCDRFGRLDGARFTPLTGVPAQTAVAAAW